MRRFRRERALILVLAVAAILLFVLTNAQGTQKTGAPTFAVGNNSVDQPTAALVIFVVILFLLLLLWFLLPLRGRPSGGGQGGSTPPDGAKAPTYFMSGDVTLLVGHPVALTGQDFVAQLRRHPLVQSEPELEAALSREARVTTFSRRQNQTLSLVVTEISVPKRVSQRQDPTLSLIDRINSKIPQYREPTAAGITVNASSPNWLANSSCHGGLVGGPGGMPVKPNLASVEGWHIVMPGFSPASGGDGVHVAIIDTMPCLTDLKRAYKKWGGKNGLMTTLLAPGGPIKLYPAGDAHLLEAVDYHLNEHEYPMPDHGLFVAGIIHSIAPKATIHLIEGLNSYGVGTLESFANGIQIAQSIALKQSLGDVIVEDMGPATTIASAATAAPFTPDAGNATQVRPDRFAASTGAVRLEPDYLPMVLNCSFVFNLPPAGTSELLDRASVFLPFIWDSLNIRDDMLITGAAGNDARGEPITSRPNERYPAAFTSVVGVGALDASGNPTLYSDLANVAGKDNFATFGGSATLGTAPGDPNVTDPSQGILGVYTGSKYPDGTPNPDGWARWAGTSFATPIISGALALALSPTAAAPNLGGGGTIALPKLHEYALEQVRAAVAGTVDPHHPDPTPSGALGPVFRATQS